MLSNNEKTQTVSDEMPFTLHVSFHLILKEPHKVASLLSDLYRNQGFQCLNYLHKITQTVASRTGI